jgi:hypothetical protein
MTLEFPPFGAPKADARPSGKGIHAGEVPVELIGTRLWASGLLDTRPFARLSDYANAMDGFCLLRGAALRTESGESSRSRLDMHIRFEEVALIAQTRAQPSRVASDVLVPKRAHRLLFVTPSLMISGQAYLHEQGSLDAFIEALDPRFIPLTRVAAQWLSGAPVGRFPFALLKRSQIIGVAAAPKRAARRAASEEAAS